MSLRTRLLILVIAAMLVPAILVGLRFVQNRASEIDAALANLAASADDVASGCSIDSSVKVMRELASELTIDFFDRTAIAFLVENEIRRFPLGSLKSAFADSHLSQDALVFNNAISTLREYRESWPAPARKSWVNRYFPKESVEK